MIETAKNNSPAAENQAAISPDIKDYKDFLEACRKNETSMMEQFDKAIMTLAGGAFAVSFVFLKDLVSFKTATDKWMLALAWYAWAAALAVNFLAYFISHCANRNAQAACYSLCEFVPSGNATNDTKTFNKLTKRILGKSLLGRSVVVVNIIAGIALISGLISISAFAVKNIGKTETQPLSENSVLTVTNVTISVISNGTNFQTFVKTHDTPSQYPTNLPPTKD